MAKTKTKKTNKRHSWLAKAYRHYAFKHTTSAIISIVAFVLVLDTALVQTVLEHLEGFGLIGVLIGSMMVTSFFTAAPGIALLLPLSQEFNPLVFGLVGGLGAMVGDWIILKIFEEKIAYELKPLIKKFGWGHILRRIRRKKERQRTLLLGMVVIITPLPDEMGIALMGLSRFPLSLLLILIYILNTLGLVVLAAATQL